MRPRANPLHPVFYHLFNSILTMEAKPILNKHLLQVANIIGEHIRQNCIGNAKAQTQKEICETLFHSNYLSALHRQAFQLITPSEFRNCINYLRNEKELMGCICSLSAKKINQKRGYFWAANPRELNDHIERLRNRAKKQIATVRATRKSFEHQFKRPCGVVEPKLDQINLNEVQIHNKFVELIAALKPIMANGKPNIENYKIAANAAIKFLNQYDNQ